MLGGRTTKLRFLDDFIIFALITPSLTIFTFLLTSVKPLQNLHHVVLTCLSSLQWAQPQTEAISLSILGILWLSKSGSSFSNLWLLLKLSTAMGAWSTFVHFCLSKNGTLTFGTAMLSELHSAMPWVAR